MRFSKHPPRAVAFASVIMLLASGVFSGTGSSGSRHYESGIKAYEDGGVADIAPHELDAARGFLEAMKVEKKKSTGFAEGYERALQLQLDLLEEIKNTSGLLLEAGKMEKASYKAYMEKEVEKAAYEYFVDQMLASGLVSQWAVP